MQKRRLWKGVMRYSFGCAHLVMLHGVHSVEFNCLQQRSNKVSSGARTLLTECIMQIVLEDKSFYYTNSCWSSKMLVKSTLKAAKYDDDIYNHVQSFCWLKYPSLDIVKSSKNNSLIASFKIAKLSTFCCT